MKLGCIPLCKYILYCADSLFPCKIVLETKLEVQACKIGYKKGCRVGEGGGGLVQIYSKAENIIARSWGEGEFAIVLNWHVTVASEVNESKTAFNLHS